MTRAVGVDEWSLYWWIGAVSWQTDDRRQENSQLVGTTCRTRDLGQQLMIRRGYSLISTVHVMVSWQVLEGIDRLLPKAVKANVQNGGNPSSRPNYRRLPLPPYVILSSQSVCH